MTTRDKIKQALNLVMLVADAIKEAKQIPSGHLYAAVMAVVDLQTYNKIIDTLKGAGLVTECNHMLTWIEPKQFKPGEYDEQTKSYPGGRF